MTTYDGLHYDFQADGTYVLTRSTRPQDNFQIQIQTAPNLSNEATSFTTMMAAQMGTDVLTIGINRADPVWVDGTPDTTLNAANPVQTFAGGSLVAVSPTDFEMTWASGERVAVDDYGPYLDTNVTLGAAQGPGSMQGLLGSDSGQSQDFQCPTAASCRNQSATQIYTTYLLRLGA